MTIPKVQETDDQRKLRVLQDEVDRLRSEVSSIPEARKAAAPIQDQNIPKPVLFAANYTLSHIHLNRPQVVMNEYGDVEFVQRIQSVEELGAAGAAFDLLREYFDAHNPRIESVRQLRSANAAIEEE